MMTITPEQRQAVEKAGGLPVRLEDPENHRAYVLLVEDAYQRLAKPGSGRRLRFPKFPKGSFARRMRSSAISPSC